MKGTFGWILIALVAIHTTTSLMGRKRKDPWLDCLNDECGGGKAASYRLVNGGPLACVETPGDVQRFIAEDACVANCTVRVYPKLSMIHENTLECLCKNACPHGSALYCSERGGCGLWGSQCDQVCTGEAKYYGQYGCQHPCDCNKDAPDASCGTMK